MHAAQTRFVADWLFGIASSWCLVVFTMVVGRVFNGPSIQASETTDAGLEEAAEAVALHNPIRLEE